MADFIVNQVKGLIINGLKQYAKELGSSLNDVGLIIYTNNEAGTPLVRLFNRIDGKMKIVRDTDFVELGKKMSVPVMFRMAFKVERDLPIWLQKFLLKSAKDKKIDIKKSSYFLMNMEMDNDLHAFMYVDWKPFPEEDNEVGIDYILQTE